jgi:hypothetical protein
MASRAEATLLPLRVARTAMGRVRDLKLEPGGLTEVDLTVSSVLEEALRAMPAVDAFTDEIGELLSAVTESKVKIRLDVDASFAPGEISLTRAQPEKQQLTEGTLISTSTSRAPDSLPAERHFALQVGSETHIVGGSITLGRSSSSGLVIADSEVSRAHSEVAVVDGELIVRDLGSTNGTRVNGDIITAPTKLSAGDVITVGNTEIGVVTA